MFFVGVMVIHVAKNYTGGIGTYSGVLADLPVEYYLELLTSCGFWASHLNARNSE
jgi:hypothetical protein